MTAEKTDYVEQIWEVLRRYFSAEHEIDQWLNTPHPELDNRTSRSLITEGRAEVVYDMLKSMQRGIST